ncbi:MAG: endonuclease/exonuclease/phosphatase family protein [Deltaproteobacteria bacterium]|nr:endonuclease/exonuclease/phosphatase family protein [Deltaproteobacteria bacterium]
MTYNVLFSGGNSRQTIATIRDANADIVLLQEVSPGWKDRLEVAFAARYPYRKYLARKGAYGYAVLSRVPLSPLATIQVGASPPSSVCAIATIGRARTAVCSLHLKSARSAFQEHRARLFSELEENTRLRTHQWAALLAWLDENAAGLPQILAGDTNTPDFDPVLAVLTARHIDAARSISLIPGSTYPTDNTVLRMRLDYVLVSPAVGVVSVEVVSGGGSDHQAVVAELTLQH